MTLGIDVLLLSVDSGLRVVRDRESTGYAMRAADLIELAVARRVGVGGGWVRWLHVLDAQPTGEPLLDASLASLAASGKQLPADWICEQAGVVNEGLALVEAQGAVRLYSRRLTSRLTLTEPVHRVLQGRRALLIQAYPVANQPDNLAALRPYVPIGDSVRMSVAILSYVDTVSFGITADYESSPDLGVFTARQLPGVMFTWTEARVWPRRLPEASPVMVSGSMPATQQYR